MQKIISTLGLLTAAPALFAQVALKADFERSAGYLYSKTGTAKVIASSSAHSGKKVMQFTASGKTAVLTSGTMLSNQAASPIVRLSFFARGKGNISAGLSDGIYLGKGKYKYSTYDGKEKIALTGKWQKIEFTRNFQGTAPVGVYVRIRLDAGGSAEIDDLLLETLEDKTVKVTAEKASFITREGEKLPECKFSVNPENEAVKLFIAPDRSFSSTPPEKTVPGLYRAAASVNGTTAETLISVLPAAQYEQFDKAAQKIKFKKHSRILILGDSIHDRNRGRNTADKLLFWLNKYNPGKVEIRNAAVSGDYITLIESRLNGKARKHELKKYDKLFDAPYQLIFIAVGSNDNRTWRKDNYQKPLVAFNEQTASMTRVINILKKHNPDARIILLSPVSANEPYQQKRAAAAAKANQPYVKFGDPDLTHQGIAAQKKAAAAAKVEYFDYYEDMRRSCDDAFFARNDVIHQDEKGYNYLAQKILEYLSNK